LEDKDELALPPLGAADKEGALGAEEGVCFEDDLILFPELQM
jgi:hypothetical protein